MKVVRFLNANKQSKELAMDLLKWASWRLDVPILAVLLDSEFGVVVCRVGQSLKDIRRKAKETGQFLPR